VDDVLALGIFVGFWNAIALGIGIVGLFRPEVRPSLARFVGRQAAAALAISLVFWVLGIVGSPFGRVDALGSLVAWSFWAGGGLLPFTIAILLRARPRIDGEG